MLRAQTQLRLFTAQRGGEVSNARWADIDLEKGWWTIPAADAKNKLAHRVPLNRHAKSLLQNLRSAAPADQAMVFEGGRGKRQRTGAVDVEGLDDVRGHDLRRTVASRLASAGVPRLTIAKLLNHIERSVTSVYDRHSYDAEKRAAVEQWADLLDEVLETNPARNQ